MFRFAYALQLPGGSPDLFQKWSACMCQHWLSVDCSCEIPHESILFLFSFVSAQLCICKPRLNLAVCLWIGVVESFMGPLVFCLPEGLHT